MSQSFRENGSLHHSNRFQIFYFFWPNYVSPPRPPPLQKKNYQTFEISQMYRIHKRFDPRCCFLILFVCFCSIVISFTTYFNFNYTRLLTFWRTLIVTWTVNFQSLFFSLFSSTLKKHLNTVSGKPSLVRRHSSGRYEVCVSMYISYSNNICTCFPQVY